MTDLAWQPGERERWAARAAVADHGQSGPDWADLSARATTSIGLTPRQTVWLFLRGPEELALPLLEHWTPSQHRGRVDLAMATVARFGIDALPLAANAAQAEPDRMGFLLMPFAGAEPATLVSGWLRNLGSSRLWARMWLRRHEAVAVPALTAAAAGKASRARQNARDALRWLSDGSAAPAVERPRKIPHWAVPSSLPLILLRNDAGTLPESSAAELVAALTGARLAEPPEPPPGCYDPVEIIESSAAAQPMVLVEPPSWVTECAPHSLAEFGWALFEGWLAAGMPAEHAWALLAQAALADEPALDRLAPLVRAWPARSRYARAIDGLAVLATIGTDAALRHLHEIETGMSGGPTNDRARTYFAQAAARRGISAVRLEDRLAPAHGLDTGLTLDYGPRAFEVRVDTSLTPYVRAVPDDGRRLARPPKPGVRDSPAAAGELERFGRIRRELRAETVTQAARFERDMLSRRARSVAGLRGEVLPHPLLGPIARRLLWLSDGRALRIAEDGTFADVHDSTVTLDEDAAVTVAHPALLGAELPAWSAVFLDYEIMQPFPQLHRPVLHAAQVVGRVLEVGRIIGLDRFGWLRAGYEHHQFSKLVHELPDGLALVADVSPGFPITIMPNTPDQRITDVWVDASWSDHWPSSAARRAVSDDGVDPVAVSEALAALSSIFAHRPG